MRPILKWVKRHFWCESEWQEEMQSHIAMRSEWNEQQSGMSRQEAQRQAEKQFGSPLRTLENVREVHMARWLGDLLQDLNYAVRILRRSPAFLITALATMAVGIGAATAIFSMVDPLLFRPLPYPHGDRLVSVGIGGPIDMNEFIMGSIYLDWRERQTAFAYLTSMRPAAQCDLTLRAPQRVHCIAVESNFLQTLGVKPILGREFSTEQDRPHAPLTALLSYDLRQSRFGGGADALGQIIHVDDQPARIVGVLPKDFTMPERGEVDVLLPEQMDTSCTRPERDGVSSRFCPFEARRLDRGGAHTDVPAVPGDTTNQGAPGTPERDLLRDPILARPADSGSKARLLDAARRSVLPATDGLYESLEPAAGPISLSERGTGHEGGLGSRSGPARSPISRRACFWEFWAVWLVLAWVSFSCECSCWWRRADSCSWRRRT